MTDRTNDVKPTGEMVSIPRSALLAFAAFIAPYVSAVLARSGVEPELVFTSRDGERPPRVSRRAFRERCAKIPGARREGKLWIVSRADWFASFRRPSIRPVVVAAPPPAANDADAMLEAAGLRPSRRAG